MTDDASFEDVARLRMKKELRRRMRAIRKAIPKEARNARSLAIADAVTELPEFQAASALLAFASLPTEVDTASIIGAARKHAIPVALPRVVHDDLSLHIVEDLDALQAGAFGVREPTASSPPLADDRVDFVLVPGLAFDPRGHRLGYGGGYYDRLLQRIPNTFTCAVGFDFQFVSELPNTPHDVAVRAIVTDRRVCRVDDDRRDISR